MLDLDHVVIGVSDPNAAATTFRARFGLGVVPGGMHPGGTGNWLIPLEPPQYLELLYIADPTVLAAGPSAGLLAVDLTANPLLAFALRTDDIAAIGRRLNIEPVPGGATGVDGSSSRWRVLSHGSARLSSRPFFIEYDDPFVLRPQAWRDRYTVARHSQEIARIAWVEVGGDEVETREWVGDNTLPIRFASGPPGLRAVAIASAMGEIVVKPVE
jgi:Glyoxalase-like domain